MIHGEVQTTNIDPIEQLRSRLRVKNSEPGGEEYDQSRTMWNGSIDRKPAVIVRCAGVSDIRHAFEYAQRENLAVSVKGRRPQRCWATRFARRVDDRPRVDEGDASRPGSKTAQAQAGMIWRDFDLETCECSALPRLEEPCP